MSNSVFPLNLDTLLKSVGKMLEYLLGLGLDLDQSFMLINQELELELMQTPVQIK